MTNLLDFASLVSYVYTPAETSLIPNDAGIWSQLNITPAPLSARTSDWRKPIATHPMQSYEHRLVTLHCAKAPREMQVLSPEILMQQKHGDLLGFHFC